MTDKPLCSEVRTDYPLRSLVRTDQEAAKGGGGAPEGDAGTDAEPDLLTLSEVDHPVHGGCLQGALVSRGHEGDLGAVHRQLELTVLSRREGTASANEEVGTWRKWEFL